MQPLRITFDLLTPMVAPEQPFHLDALLAWAVVQKTCNLDDQHNLPIEKHVAKNGRWCFKASRILAKPDFRSNIHSIRSFSPWEWGESWDISYVGGRKSKLTVGTGPYKAYQFFFSLLHVKKAYAWCIGEKERVESLLQKITHIGKLSRLDSGRVKSIVVENDETAFENWKIRTMPDKQDGYKAVFATLKPPYWRRKDREDAFEVPGLKILEVVNSL